MHAISKFVITIEIDTEHKIFGFTGRILHGAFLQLLRLKDPLLAENLHKSKDITPFVITPLVKHDKGKLGKFEIRTIKALKSSEYKPGKPTKKLTPPYVIKSLSFSIVKYFKP